MRNIFDDFPALHISSGRKRKISWVIVFVFILISLLVIAMVVISAEKITATTLKETLPGFGGFYKVDIIERVVIF